MDSVADVAVLLIDERVSAEWAALRVEVAERGRRVNLNDVWIAATAVAHDIPVVSQDADFDPLDGIGGLSVVRV